jgi:glycosyltransferase involved in cell wall biosynthesis
MSLLTILVPNYNRAASLRRSLESARAQTFQDWRLVVGDNASEDDSAGIVASFPDSRIKLVRRERNVGYIHNTNLLLNEADTELVAFLHSDDWWEPDYLGRMIGLLERAPRALIAASAARVVYDSGASRIWAPHKRWAAAAGEIILDPAAAVRLLVRRWAPFTPSDVVVRRELFQRFQFDETLPYTNDWLMWARAASVGGLALCPDPLVTNRKQIASVTGEADRAHRWAPESIRLADTIAADWAAREPYPGAIRELRAMNTIRMLIKAYEMAEQGRRSDTRYLSRLARQSAPSWQWAGLARVSRGTLALAPSSVLHQARRLAVRTGTAIAARRRREETFRPGYGDSRRQLSWLLEDALTVLAEPNSDPRSGERQS